MTNLKVGDNIKVYFAHGGEETIYNGVVKAINNNVITFEKSNNGLLLNAHIYQVRGEDNVSRITDASRQHSSDSECRQYSLYETLVHFCKNLQRRIKRNRQ